MVPTRSLRRSAAFFFVAIEFSESGGDQAVSILHELGHLIEYQVIGQHGVWATDPPLDASLIEWERAVQESSYWQMLDRMRTQPTSATKYGDLDSGDLAYLDYFLGARELFARSYVQWAISRSGDRLLQAQLDNLASPSDPSDEFPERWDVDDFLAVVAALDDLFSSS